MGVAVGVGVGAGVVGFAEGGTRVPVGEGAAVAVPVPVGLGAVDTGLVGAVVVGRPEGVGAVPSPALQEVLSIRQLPGSACAAPAPWATKPTTTLLPGSSRLLHASGLTVTCWPAAVKVAFQSESIFAPAGRSKLSVQSSIGPLSGLVTRYWPV